jgi:hypothetical protein
LSGELFYSRAETKVAIEGWPVLQHPALALVAWV